MEGRRMRVIDFDAPAGWLAELVEDVEDVVGGFVRVELRFHEDPYRNETAVCLHAGCETADRLCLLRCEVGRFAGLLSGDDPPDVEAVMQGRSEFRRVCEFVRIRGLAVRAGVFLMCGS